METPLERFAKQITGKPLYPYQLEPALAILHSINNNLGWIITIMMSRQSGKNQLSAMIEAFLLWTRREGYIIKAAPTFSPQIINSKRRLMSLLEVPALSNKIWTSYATIGLSPSSDRATVRRHVGPAVQFFSAAPESNVVGATANILLEVDEAQDVLPDKFDTEFRPMAATTNATTVMYGTAWSEDTLLAVQKARNLEIWEKYGERRHFEYDWEACAAVNPNYKKYVEAEIERLGIDNQSIQTQYLLKPVAGAGYFLTELQKSLLQGTHQWEDEPQEGYIYIAGLDVGGEERVDPENPGKINTKRDATVLTIGRIHLSEQALPVIDVIHNEWWTGWHYTEQYAGMVELMQRWQIRKLVVDYSGIGAGLGSLLNEKFNIRMRLRADDLERVTLFTFSRPKKSKIGFQLLNMISSGRIKIYSRDQAPGQIYDEFWKQLRRARYRLPGQDLIDFYVKPGEGHDDFLISLALLTEALEAMYAPAESTVVKAKKLYEGESRF